MASPLQYKLYSKIKGDKKLYIANCRHIGDAETIAKSETDQMDLDGDKGIVFIVHFGKRILVWSVGADETSLHFNQ